MGWDGTGPDGAGQDRMGGDRMGWDGMRRNGMRWDWTGWDGREGMWQRDVREKEQFISGTRGYQYVYIWSYIGEAQVGLTIVAGRAEAPHITHATTAILNMNTAADCQDGPEGGHVTIIVSTPQKTYETKTKKHIHTHVKQQS